MISFLGILNIHLASTALIFRGPGTSPLPCDKLATESPTTGPRDRILQMESVWVRRGAW